MENQVSPSQDAEPGSISVSLTVEQLQKIAGVCPGVMFILVQQPTGLMVFDYISPAAEVIYELSQSAILANADQVFQQFHPDDLAGYWQALTVSREHLSPLTYEWRIITPSGQVKWLKGTGQPEARANGETVWYGTVEEITQNKLREIELSEWRDRYRLAEQASGQVLYEYRFAEDQIIWGTNAQGILGYAADQLPLTKNALTKLIHPDDCDSVLIIMEDCIQHQVTFHVEYRLQHQAGHYLWVEDRNQFLTNPQGEAIGVIGMLVDITDRQQQELQLKESENRFRQLTDNIHQVFYLANAQNSDLLYVSSRYEEIWGRSCQSLYDDPLSFQDSVYPEDRAIAEQAYLAPRQGLSHPHKYRIVRPDGSLRWIRDYNFPIKDETGTIYQVCGIAEDITERKEAELALIKLKKLHQEAQRIAKLGNWELDLKTNHLYWSEEIFRIFEMSAEEFIPSYEGFLNVIHPDDRELVNDAYTQHLHDQTPYQVIHRLLMPDGRIKYVQEQCETVFAEDGTPLVSQGTVQDITALKTAEEALKAANQSLEALITQRTAELQTSETRFRRLFDLNIVGVMFTNFQGQITEANDYFLDVIGYSREELEAGKINWQTLTPPDFIALDLAAIAHLQDDGAIKPWEKAYYHKQGHLVPVLLAVGMVSEEQCVCVVIDISDRKMAEMQLQNLSERLTLALQAGAIGTWEWQLGETTYWDQETLKMYGLPPHTPMMTSDQWLNCIHPEDRDRVMQKVSKIIAEEHTFEFEFRIIRPDGEVRWIHDLGIVQRDKTGQARRILGINRDITEQKTYENNLKNTNLELEKLLKLREEVLQFREDMSNMIIHDLRNPLSSLLLATNLAKSYFEVGYPTAMIHKKFDQITESGKRMQHMIDSLLIMAKLEAGKILLNPSPTDLAELGHKIINDFELSATIHHIHLQANLPELGRTILIDTSIVRRIIENLLSNAIKFSPAHSHVILTLEYLNDSHFKLTVADFGVGISEEQKEGIFNKFEVGNLKANIPQIGLGLAFCKMAVEAQGGTLTLTENSPRGSVFTVEI